jgi:hypothetical protein
MVVAVRRWFKSFCRNVCDARRVAVDGPEDNFSVVGLLAGDLKVAYCPVGGGRYLPRERTVLLKHPPGSKGLWALLEAAHEAAHAARTVWLVRLLALTPARRAFSAVAVLALSFLAGRLAGPGRLSAALWAVLLAFLAAFLTALAWDEVRACRISKEWLCAYLEKCGCGGWRSLVSWVVRAEIAFEILDHLALFVLFGGASGFFWSYGRLMYCFAAGKIGTTWWFCWPP